MSGFRVTGLYSGFDTDSMIKELTSAYQSKINKVYKQKEKLEYQEKTWNDLNSKIYSFYTSSLSKAKYETTYNQTKATCSSNALSVQCSSNVSIGAQSAKVLEIAKAGYITGGKLNKEITNNSNVCETLGIESGSYDFNGTTININENTTISNLVSNMRNSGVNANFDEKQNRFYIGALSSGLENDFDLTNSDNKLLSGLGLSAIYYIDDDGKYYSDKDMTLEVINEDKLLKIKNGDAAIKVNGRDASIMLNGVEYTSKNNVFEINGLTINTNYKTTNDISINIDKDTSSVKKSIESFVGEYNDIIKEMMTLYNTSNDGYEPLTEEEKDSLSDRELEKWEDKLESSSLYKDSRLYTIIQNIKQTMNQGIELEDGTIMHLSDFGISTGNYFSTSKNERGTYNIDDEKLNEKINIDSDKVSEFFSKLSTCLYDTIYKEMGSTSQSSMYKVFNDKQINKKQESYTRELEKMEEKLAKLEEKYYKQFTAMETTLARLNSNSNYISSLFNF